MKNLYTVSVYVVLISACMCVCVCALACACVCVHVCVCVCVCLSVRAGDCCRQVFQASGLTSEVLTHVWNLSDVTRDGRLDVDEFCVACHLLRFLKAGKSVTWFILGQPPRSGQSETNWISAQVKRSLSVPDTRQFVYLKMIGNRLS